MKVYGWGAIYNYIPDTEIANSINARNRISINVENDKLVIATAGIDLAVAENIISTEVINNMISINLNENKNKYIYVMSRRAFPQVKSSQTLMGLCSVLDMWEYSFGMPIVRIFVGDENVYVLFNGFIESETIELEHRLIAGKPPLYLRDLVKEISETDYEVCINAEFEVFKRYFMFANNSNLLRAVQLQIQVDVLNAVIVTLVSGKEISEEIKEFLLKQNSVSLLDVLKSEDINKLIEEKLEDMRIKSYWSESIYEKEENIFDTL